MSTSQSKLYHRGQSAKNPPNVVTAIRPAGRRSRRLIILAACATAAFFVGHWSRPGLMRMAGGDQHDDTSNNGEHNQLPYSPPSHEATSEGASKQQQQGKTKPKTKPLSHRYRSDGLLEVNPNGAHPIFELISNAESAWEAKLKMASDSLEDAVDEYYRRYKRFPPKGFDEWWAYAQEHNVQLPDEYDSIYHNLEPFWGVHPRDLQHIYQNWENNSDTKLLSFGKEEGQRLRIFKNDAPDDKRDEFDESVRLRLELLEGVEKHIPPFRALISGWDNPNLLTDWELKALALEAAATRTYIDIDDPPPKKHSWLSACNPETPAAKRQHYDFYKPVPQDMLPESKPVKTFIYNHRVAMDPCQHPSHLFLVGQFISHNEGPGPHPYFIPQFSSCATPLHYDILPIPPRGFGEDKKDIDWEKKFDERLLWKGSNTGMWFGEGSRWEQSQRARLVKLANEVKGNITILPSPKEGEEGEIVGSGEVWPKARINPAMLDMTFGGKPIQCDKSVCGTLEREYEWRKHMSVEDASRYKYIIDVDGNGWSSRFKRLMSSNSVVLKSTVYPEWFTDRIQPWVHYVPVQVDLSDLYDSFVFFRGDLKGEGNHDQMAKKIALEGKKWVETYWRDEDATAYMFRLFLEYARVMSLDREAMTYKPRHQA